MAYFKTPALTETTKALFTKRIDNWLGWMKTPGKLETLLTNSKRALKVLKATEDITHSDANHHNYISAVLAYIRHENPLHPQFEEWKQIMKQNDAPLKEHYLSGKPTERQEKHQVEWTEIGKVRDKLPMGSAKMLLAMYTLINPERADYFSCKLYRDGTPSADYKGNYILVKEQRLVLQDYKTKKTYGQIEIPLPEDLMVILKAYLESGIVKDYLFENELGNPFTRQGFSTWANRKLKTAFSRPTTLTAIRHAFASQIDFNRPIKELNEIAKSMGHSVGTQRVYRWDEIAVAKNEVIE